MRDYMTPQDFAWKIRSEGNVVEALHYGLKSTDLDPADISPHGAELRAAWVDVEAAWLKGQGERSKAFLRAQIKASGIADDIRRETRTSR